MEGDIIFEKSLKELKLINKSIGSDSIIINFKDLDTVTAGLIRDSISKVISTRMPEIQNVITSGSLK